MPIKTYEDRGIRIVCRAAEEPGCPEGRTACERACAACGEGELMVLDAGHVVARGVLVDREADADAVPEGEPGPGSAAGAPAGGEAA